MADDGPCNGSGSSGCVTGDALPNDYLDDLLYFVRKIEQNHKQPAIVLNNANRLRLVIESQKEFIAHRKAVEWRLANEAPRKRGILAWVFGK